MSAGASLLPHGDQWKDPTFILAWKARRRQELLARWNPQPLFSGIANAAQPAAESPFARATELVQFENESLLDRAHRLESELTKLKKGKASCRAKYRVPSMLAKAGDDWIMTPAVSRARPGKIEKSKAMYEADLVNKANRELACNLLGGEVECRSGHVFRVSYQCGNRYCVSCGPRAATRLFKKHSPRFLFVATRLLMCRAADTWGGMCEECSKAIEEKRLPHWPPPRGVKPRVVVAKIDFTLKNTGQAGPTLMRDLNLFIKKFCRAMERRFHIRRSEYGLAYCDELGAGNTNAHAHGIYVGPWLPQKHKELSKLWSEITGDSFIISIKYAKRFEMALYHAIKYPAKFAELSTPERLAQLEIIFHRVRRFHTLAAFYSPEAPPEPDPPVKRCPLCDETLSEVKTWQTLEDLERRGLKDLQAVRLEMAREHGLTGPGPPCP
jgi:hypothetical protein